MARRMTANIDSYGQTGDMRRIRSDKDPQSSGASAEPLRSLPFFVYLFEDLFFKFLIIGIMNTDLSEKRIF